MGFNSAFKVLIIYRINVDYI